MNLTEQEIAKLKATKNKQQWNACCNEIKAARSGQYPPDWWPLVIQSGLLNITRLNWN